MGVHTCGAPRRSGVRRFFWLCLVAAACVSAYADIRWAVADADATKAENPPAKADDANQPNANQQPDADKKPASNALGQGFLIRVNLPITDDVDTRVRRSVTQLLSNIQPGGPRPVIVVELWPGQSEFGAGSDFSRALSLAKFLWRDLKDLAPRVKTVAYLPKSVKGHAVLVAMACEEIVMAPDAEIGEAGIDEHVIGPTIRSGYKEIAQGRGTIPAALAPAMLDRDLSVLKVSTDVGTEYIFPNELDELKKQHLVKSADELKPRPLLVDGRRARQDLGLVSYLVDDDRRQALPGAEFVVVSIAVDRERTWKLDFEVPKRHGVRHVLGENGGPGALFHAARNVPPMLAICRDMEELCPDALLVNFTNPEPRMCLAVSRYSKVRVVGLCHQVYYGLRMAAHVLGRAQADLDLKAAGINHFTWISDLRDRRTGQDLLPSSSSACAPCRPTTSRCRASSSTCSGSSRRPATSTRASTWPGPPGPSGEQGYDFEAAAAERQGMWDDLARVNAGTTPVSALPGRSTSASASCRSSAACSRTATITSWPSTSPTAGTSPTCPTGPSSRCRG